MSDKSTRLVIDYCRSPMRYPTELRARVAEVVEAEAFDLPMWLGASLSGFCPSTVSDVLQLGPTLDTESERKYWWLPDDVVANTSKKYIEAYEHLTGRSLPNR